MNQFLNIRLFKTALAACTLCIGANIRSAAQTIITPTLADNTWYTTTDNITHIETAMIAYGTSGLLYGILDHEVGGMSATDYIHIKDDAVGTASIPSTSL